MGLAGKEHSSQKTSVQDPTVVSSQQDGPKDPRLLVFVPRGSPCTLYQLL